MRSVYRYSFFLFFFSSRRRHTRSLCDWSSDVCSSDLDENYNVVEGVLQDITIPIGALTIAEATQNVNFTGNLDADGERPTQGSLSLLTGIAGAGLTVIGQPADRKSVV